MTDAPVAFITGASAGIGEAFARLLHKKGYSVILVARREDKLSALCESLNAIRKGSASYEVLDLSRRQDLKVAEEKLREGNIDLLVNNVGRGSFGYFHELPVDEEEQMVVLNILAPLRLAHAAVPSLVKKGQGGIIFLSSIAAFQPLPFMGNYAATKSYNFFQSLSLYAELKRFGVHVMAVCPGPTATEFGGVARVPGSVTGIARDTPEMVAEVSMKAYDRKQPFTITGIRSWFIALSSRVFPVRFSLWLVERELRKVLVLAGKV